MKTAISMEDDLFRAVSELAEQSRRPRSQIVSEAVRDYLERRKNSGLLEKINHVYQKPDAASEKRLRRRHKSRYAVRFMDHSW